MAVSDRVKSGPEKAPHRSLWKALGLTDEELKLPLIGVVSAYSEIVPGHMNLDKIADAVKAGERLKGLTFAAAYCSDTTRAQQTAEKILDINEAAGNPRPALVTDMHFREQFYGYYEGLDMAMAWYAAGAPHGVKTYNQIVEKFGLGASRDFLKEADPFHDAESDEEYWTRVEGAFRLIADNPNLKDGDDVLQISHGNTLLSLGHRFGGPDLDLNERPANGSVTVIDFDTDKPFGEAVTIVSYGK